MYLIVYYRNYLFLIYLLFFFSEGRSFYNDIFLNLFRRTMVMSPKHTPDGLKVMYYGFNERNSHLFRPTEIYKRMRLMLDIYQKKGIDFTGIHVVIDTRNVTLSNISQFDLFQLKNLIKHAQVCDIETLIFYHDI